MDYPEFKVVLAERRRSLAAFLERALSGSTDFVWEVGCGHGHFLAAYAQAHRGRPCIGVDIASDRIARAVRKRDRARLEHLHFVQGDARLFLDALPAGVMISRVFILFPDPWPKLRHHKHRILQPDFLQRLRERAGEETRLYFRTDFEPYFEEARATVQANAGWRIIDEPWAFEFETVFQQRAESHSSFVAGPR